VHVILETPRLIMRQFTKDDVDNLFDLNSDPAVMRYITGGRPTPREVIREKCGLTLVRTGPYEGTDVIEGAEHGEVEYALTRPEWEARTAGEAGT
jgi:RimJ/RimL family protein N-acetyltransferase